MVGTQVGCSALTAYAWPIPLAAGAAGAAGAAAGALHRPIELLGDCHCVREKH